MFERNIVNMKEEVKYLTPEDIPYLYTPCYITNTGELWQYSKREKCMVRRQDRYDRACKVCKVSIMLHKDGKCQSSSINLASFIYRAFSNHEKPLASRLFINYKDGNPMNCCIDNLYVSKKYLGQPLERDIIRRRNNILQSYDIRLTLSDLPSIKCFIDMKKRWCKKVICKNTLTIDTTGWSDSDRNEVEQYRDMDDVYII